MEEEARRRLIRQATAANQAMVKGNCLMVMQMLTGREVIRSHFPWQLMTKNAMWRAFEHRRELQGFDERQAPDGEVLLNAAEANASSGEDSTADSQALAPDQDASNSDGANPEDVSSPSKQNAGAADSKALEGGDFGAGAQALLAGARHSWRRGAVDTAGRPRARGTGVAVHLKNDSFYDDYLHRGDVEDGDGAVLIDGPLQHMGYYDYGAHVHVVEGDPYDLGPSQYAFALHHAKFENYVQELRTAPVVPFIDGFTMPSVAKDAETNACFKQLLLRPHHCDGLNCCSGHSFTSGFCEKATTRWMVKE